MDSTLIDNSKSNEEHIRLVINERETDNAVPGEKESPENSEYDSADADSYSDDENVKIRSRASDLDDHSEEGSIILEREEGDGQESIPLKKIDDDEDKKNPQYIPKRGTFYEHDDRTLEDIVETKSTEESEKDKDGKKKVWQDKKERWSHDRFNEPEQAPKSRTELIAIYGYDIRNEEGPPRARRRRKYGRGPNKYTRNWEDEEAYNKPTPIVRKAKKSLDRENKEEFPPLVTDSSEQLDNDYEKNITVKIDQDSQSRRVEVRNDPPKEKIVDQLPKAEVPVSNTNPHENYNNKNYQQRIGSGRINDNKKEPNECDYNGFTTKSRNARNRKVTNQQKVLPPKNRSKDDYIQSQNFYTTAKNTDLENDMSKLHIDENGSKSSTSKANYNNNLVNNQRQSSVPPRLQSEQKGSKRYSSMRQKSLPETNTPPLTNYQHATTFYPNEYNQQSVPSPTQQILHQNPQMLPAPTQVAHVSLQPAPLPQQVPVTAAPILQTAPFPPQVYPQPPPAFIQPTAVTGPPFIPAPPPAQLINFVQSQPAFQPNFQGYQQPFNSVTPPTELYQPQGGITYYSTDQQLTQRQVPQKRPKAAIPIVAPPSYDKKEENSIKPIIGTQVENNEVIEVQQ